MIAKGFEFVTLLNDSRLLVQAGRKVVEDTRSGGGGEKREGGVY
jgi:hypothetical protein